jgi:hypothetical protein
MGESVPNLLDGIFRVAYSYSTTGFTAQVNTSLDGNVTIGNSATNYSLLLNGVAVSTSGGSGVLPSNWAQYPAVQDVNMSGYRLYSPNNTIFFGVSAGLGSISGTVIAIGRSAAVNNIGSASVIAIGNNAAASNGAGNVVAIGSSAGNNNLGGSVVIIGNNAGSSNTGGNVIAIGTTAATNNTGINVIAIGNNAGYSNTGSLCTFIGNNPNVAVTNASDYQLIVYSTTAGNPLIQGNTLTNIVTLNRLQVKTVDPSTSATGPLSQIYYSASDKQFYYY